MLSVVIATRNDAHRLVATLAALVPGATAGVVSEAIVADSGSTDDTAAVADVAGCRWLSSDAPPGERLAQAAASARAPWLLFLRPGAVLDPGWVAEVRRFIEAAEIGGRADKLAAVFRRAPSPDTLRPALVEALWFVATSIALRPHPDQGLLIAKRCYLELGRHTGPDAERGLLRRLGGKRLVTLRSGVVMLGSRDS
jgi:glycosyltransferase involved in cell wall biosynthesis